MLKVYVVVHYDDFYFVVAESEEKAMIKARRRHNLGDKSDWVYCFPLDKADGLKDYTISVARKQ